jgi:SAM-dependent MidA family methyltransferase
MLERLQPISPPIASMRSELPQLGPDEQAHSERVAALIRDEISAAGDALDFARYMELALYAPGLGYYSAGAAKLGADGDFVTAPELGFVFARCLARAVAPVLRETHGDILELGPGSGALAIELLRELERLDALPGRYRLLERSADLRERQQRALMNACPHLFPLTEWLDASPAESWSGVLIANEVADALPVHLFALRDGGLYARHVGVDKSGGFIWREVHADAALAQAIDVALGDRRASLPRPYLSEVCTLLTPWFADVTRYLNQGLALFIDYGYSHDAYYHPQRDAGSLRCHFRHRAHDDPLILVGLQDITAWVDFDALTAAGKAAGFECVADVTQAEFLMTHGLDAVFSEAYAQSQSESARYRLAQEVKRLTLPSEMGEGFRVVALRPEKRPGG